MGVCTKERKGETAEGLRATPCTNSLGGESGGHKHEGCGGRSACWKCAAVSGFSVERKSHEHFRQVALTLFPRQNHFPSSPRPQHVIMIMFASRARRRAAWPTLLSAGACFRLLDARSCACIRHP